MFGMFGIECVAIKWDGKRIHLDEMNEWGGFLTVDEAVNWATDYLIKYTQSQVYQKIEVITEKGVQKTLDSLTLVEQNMGKEVVERYKQNVPAIRNRLI